MNSDSPGRVTSKIISVLIDRVSIDDRRRACDPEAVEVIAQSISVIGLKTPITVRAVERVLELVAGKMITDYFLVTGRHRLEAARSLGWSEIECFVIGGDQADARMWELAENLHRKELSALERATYIADWVELANDRPGQVDQKGNGGRPEGGIAEAARVLPVPGKTEEARRKTIERAVKINEISPAAKEAAETAGLADNQSALLAVADQPVKEQVQKVTEIAEQKRGRRTKRRHAQSGAQTFLQAIIRYPADLKRKDVLLAELDRVVREFPEVKLLHA